MAGVKQTAYLVRSVVAFGSAHRYLLNLRVVRKQVVALHRFFRSVSGGLKDGQIGYLQSLTVPEQKQDQGHTYDRHVTNELNERGFVIAFDHENNVGKRHHY